VQPLITAASAAAKRRSLAKARTTSSRPDTSWP
jgi:hypothetical protein